MSTCPLRISLFGGSTDNPKFIEKYGYGSVISFSCNLKTYISFHEDKIGYNNHLHKYVINYSLREEVSEINKIKNEVIKVVLDYFRINPATISLTSDIYSQGSGLASSSSYIISLIKAISIKQKKNLSNYQICKIAYDLEKKINPYCGLQDPYGCGIGGFKRIEFIKNSKINVKFLPSEIFELFDFNLIFTGINRNSKDVLSDVSNNIEKSYDLLPIVDLAEKAINGKNFEQFVKLFKKSWDIKKTTSKLILENNTLKKIDTCLSNNSSVLAHKLCGAGNGGFFLTISKKNKLKLNTPNIKINVCHSGVEGVEI